MVPKAYFLTKGIGKHKDYLQSFELALRDAGIQHCNIVTVSSILPPACKKMTVPKGKALLRPGQITYVVMSKYTTNEPNRLIASSVGIAIPSDKTAYGYVSEHHSFGQTDEKAGEYAEDLAATMLATSMGMDFNPETAWDERKQLFRSSGMFIRTTNVTQSAMGDKNGLWTTVLSAVVFLLKTQPE